MLNVALLSKLYFLPCRDSEFRLNDTVIERFECEERLTVNAAAASIDFAIDFTHTHRMLVRARAVATMASTC